MFCIVTDVTKDEFDEAINDLSYLQGQMAMDVSNIKETMSQISTGK